MKNRIIYMVMMFAMFFTANTIAQNNIFPSSFRVYIDPGHDGFGSNDRNIATIPHAAGVQAGFWESSSNVRKGLALRDFLNAHGATTGISRTTTPQSVGLSARMTAANNFNASVVVSIHSDAFNGSVNRPVGLYHSTNRHANAISLANAITWWLADNPVTRWSETPVARPNTRAQNLTMNSNTARPAVLIESSFHDYRPEAHRYLSPVYARMKAYNYMRGLLRFRGTDPAQLNTGVIMGEVREHDRRITTTNPANGNRYLSTVTPRLTDRDWVVNGARVELIQNGNVVQSMNVDNNWNGIFGFFNVAPGTYQIRVSHTGYTTQTFNSTVTRGNITGHRVNLRRGDNPTQPLRLVMGRGEAGANPNTPPYGTHVTSVQAGTTLYLGIDGNNNAASPQWLSRVAHTLTSSNTNVATINAEGIITTRAAGATTITATGSGRTGTINLTVTASPEPPLLLNFSTTASAPFSFVGNSQEIGTALHLVVNTGTAANPTHVAGGGLSSYTLTSSSTGVATIAANGSLNLISEGTTIITATGGGRTGTAQLTVQRATGDLPPVNGQLRLRVVAHGTGQDGAEITTLPVNSSTAGNLWIWDAATNVAVPRGNPTVYAFHPAHPTGGSYVNEWGTINTLGISNGTMLTIRVQNGTRSNWVTLMVGTPGPPEIAPLNLVIGTTEAPPYEPHLTAPFTLPAGEVGFLGIRRQGSTTWESRLAHVLTSSNTDAATIDEFGAITAINAGTTTIRAENRIDNVVFARGEITLTVTGGTPYRNVSFSAGANGTLTATVDGEPITSGTAVLQGKDVVFTASASAGHRIKRWTINGEDAGETDNVLILTNLTTAVTVTVEFEQIPSLAIASYDPQGIQEESFRPIVRIEFARLLDEATIEGAITVTNECGNVIEGVQSYDVVNGRSVLHFMFNQDLVPQATYTVTLDGVASADGVALAEPFTFEFTARPRAVASRTVIDDFNEFNSATWFQPTGVVATVGVVSAATLAETSDTRVARVDHTGSVRMNYQWEAAHASPIIRWNLRPAGRTTFVRAGHQVEAYLFGDGSGTRVRVAIRTHTNTSPEEGAVLGNIYPSAQTITVDWTGWRRVSWDMTNLGNAIFATWWPDLLAANVSVCDFIIEPATTGRVNTPSAIHFAGVQAVQLGNFVQRGTHTVTLNVVGNGTLEAISCIGGTVVCGGQVLHGKDVIFMAEPEDGYQITGWTINGVPLDGTPDSHTLSNKIAPTEVTVVFDVDMSVGIENPIDLNIQLFPNPFTNVVYITGAENSMLQVTNVLGAVVHTQQMTTANESILLRDLPAGIYFFRVEKDGQTKTMKVVKQ